MLTAAQINALRRVVTIMNQKGGVGKTSTSTNTAGALASNGFKVCLIDLDSQGSVGADLGFKSAGLGDNGAALYKAVSFGEELQPLKNVRPNLDVIPAGDHTGDLADFFQSRNRNSVGTQLAETLAPLAPRYDVVLIDTPPNSPVLMDQALLAARWLLIPTRTDSESIDGLTRLAQRIGRIAEHNPNLTVLGALIFGTSGRSTASGIVGNARKDLEGVLGDVAPVFDTFIRYAESPARASRERGQLVAELAQALIEKHDASDLTKSVIGLADDYKRLAEEIVRALANAEAEAARAEGVQV
ncbi:ParA family protein [Brevibacterium casei]|uniref:ParA family protein n=1 Tax=Brevibacterium casei TaxID=33889 RepID=UPI00223BCD64|nr:ParA family protein [Brevibacterium casei]MCT1549673.1 ParA family protein [Brevibacterium casei]MCT1559210.1 ParA family protein [Brevibacterium casei]MCT2207638.1 ParA family protein [Brevibacterium casei]